MSSDIPTPLKVAAAAGAAGFVGWNIINRPPADAIPARPPKMQSYVVPNSATPGSSAIYRSLLTPDGPVGTWRPDVATTYDSFQLAVRQFADRQFLGTRAYNKDKTRGGYSWRTYKEVAEMVTDLGSAFVNFGLARQAKVGIFSVNSEEWVIASQACYAQAMVSVALYDTLGPDAVQYVIQDADVELVVCTKQNTEKILNVIDKLPTLRVIVEVDNWGEGTTPSPKEGLQIISFADALKLGRSNASAHNPPAPSDICTINYTSGTTGNPKGVVLLHSNLVAFIGSSHLMDAYYVKAGTPHLSMTEDNDQIVHCSFLPMAHMYEACVTLMLISYGARIGFFQGDILKLLDDVAEVAPTVFVAVPRLFSRIYDKVTTAIEQAGGIKKALFDVAFAQKYKLLQQGIVTRNTFWDKILFSKIQALLGGNVRLMITGSAPIAGHVLDWFRIVFGARITEGYGMTETSAGATATRADDLLPGTVGPPNPCVEIKLVDVPEMEYLSTNNPPAGEICFRGPSIFTQYHNKPDKTAETIDADGWAHSGDIGIVTPNGQLKIVDRVKNLFKLAQGEYVAPEKLENIYARSKYVAQILVHGTSTESTLVAIVVPDLEMLGPWAKENGIANSDNLEALCKNAKVSKFILDDIHKMGTAADVRGFEKIKAIYLDHEPFSVENGLITPTFKLMRPAARKRYKEQIDALYVAINKPKL